MTPTPNPTRRKKWEPLVCGETAFVPLTQGMWAAVDLADLPLVRPYTWCVTARSRTLYARAADPAKGGHVYMHRLVLGLERGDRRRVVDHANGLGIDNRRANLRVATPSENNANVPRRRHNASPYKGVRRDGPRWTARIIVQGVETHLGSFLAAEDAARAYDAAAVAQWGEFAQPNFPDAA